MNKLLFTRAMFDVQEVISDMLLDKDFPDRAAFNPRMLSLLQSAYKEMHGIYFDDEVKWDDE